MSSVAYAGPGWLAPAAISGLGANMRDPQVVIDAQGDATVAWEREAGGGLWSVEAASRAAAGNWLAPVAISTAGKSVEGLRLVGDQQGDASAVWHLSEGSGSVVESSFKRVGGSAWEAPTAGEGKALEAAGTSGSGVSGKAPVLLPPGVDAQNPQPFSGCGYSVVWERPEGDGKVVEEACGNRDYSNAELIKWEKPILLSTPGVSAEHPRVAASTNGLVVVAWEHPDGVQRIIEAAVHRAGGVEEWRSPVPVSIGGMDAREPDVAVDSQGEGVAVWVRSEQAGRVVEASGYDQNGPALGALSIPQRGFAGVPVSFSMSASDAWAGVGQVLWGFGDALGETGTSVTHTYKYPGNYDITVTGTDTLGNFTIARGSIYIEPSHRKARAASIAFARSARKRRRVRRRRRHKTVHVAGTVKLRAFGTLFSQPRGPEGRLYTEAGGPWVAWQPQAGSVSLLNLASRRRLTRLDPAGCTNGLVSLGGGELLYECEDPECARSSRSCRVSWHTGEEFGSARYMVEDLSTGALHELAGDERLPAGEAAFGLDVIGSQWATGWATGWKGGSRFLINWHTGVVLYEYQEPSWTEEDVEDLNRVGLFKPLCAPLIRPLNKEEYVSGRFLNSTYAPPFELTAGDQQVPARLWRCGQEAPLRLSAQPGDLAGRTLSLWSGKTMYVTHLRAHGPGWHGKIYKVALPRGGKETSVNTSLTQTTVFAVVGRRLYAGRLPWAG